MSAKAGASTAHHDAEDAFQEVFARTYERLDTLRDDGALRPWLGQLARRVSIDRLRMSGREEVTGDPAELDGSNEFTARIDAALELREAMKILPENCTEILDRFFARDQSYRTISEALSIPEGMIASRISRCLTRLRGEMEAEGRSEPPRPS